MSEISLRGDDFRHDITNRGLYSDNTPILKIDNFEEVVEKTHTIVVRPTSILTFITAMFLVDSINFMDGRVATLVLPYVPGARQDRINPTGDVLFTIASVAGMINDRDFDKVKILDPHSPRTVTWINGVKVYPLSEVASRMWHGYTGIIAPDKGAKDRAGQIAETMGLPIYYGGKTRDVSTGKLTGFTLDKIPFGHYLVVDDICDGGGTFIGLGEKIREQGSYADLFVTHGIFSKGTAQLKKIYKNVYTTDSMEKADGVMTIPVVERMINS